MNIKELKELIKDLEDDVEVFWYDEQGGEIDCVFYIDEDDYRPDIPVKLVLY